MATQTNDDARCSAEVQQRIKKQHTKNGVFLGACLFISDEDLFFIGPGVEWLTVEKRTVGDALLIRITGGDAL